MLPLALRHLVHDYANDVGVSVVFRNWPGFGMDQLPLLRTQLIICIREMAFFELAIHKFVKDTNKNCTQNRFERHESPGCWAHADKMAHHVVDVLDKFADRAALFGDVVIQAILDPMVDSKTTCGGLRIAVLDTSLRALSKQLSSFEPDNKIDWTQLYGNLRMEPPVAKQCHVEGLTTRFDDRKKPRALMYEVLHIGYLEIRLLGVPSIEFKTIQAFIGGHSDVDLNNGLCYTGGCLQSTVAIGTAKTNAKALKHDPACQPSLEEMIGAIRRREMKVCFTDGMHPARDVIKARILDRVLEYSNRRGFKLVGTVMRSADDYVWLGNPDDAPDELEEDEPF